MIRLVSIGGSGDIYLVCALFDAFRRHHNRDDVTIVSKRKYAAVANLFKVPFIGDDEMVRQAEQDGAMQRTYENQVLSNVMPFYVHPCFLRSEIRVDRLTTKPDASQADMYRMILQLPADAPLTVPDLPVVATEPNTVLMIPEAVSWPNDQPAFWDKLAAGLAGAGRQVLINDPKWSLQELFTRAMRTEWVIGPQCGVMSILVTGQFPCRKTLASAALTDANKKLSFLSPQTFPYAYVTKFSNLDYDVEEFEITSENHGEIVDAIVNGQNALRLRPVDPRPVLTVHAPLSPGDFLDRLVVLRVKRQMFQGARRAGIEREYRRFEDLRKLLPYSPEIVELEGALAKVHILAFALLEEMVPIARRSFEPLADLDAGHYGNHLQIVDLNRTRVGLKREIDRVCRGPYTEVKSYYGPEGA